MKLLILNTCGAEGSIALADTLLAEPVRLVTMPGRSASELLVLQLREMLTQAGWTLAEIAAIGVVTGPGSFTGVRVGLSAAKGLSEAAGVPLIAISRLELLAAQAHGRSVCALLDAGRGEFYCGRFRDGEALGESLMSLDDAMAVSREADAVLVCEDAVERAFADRFEVRRVAEPTAADALPLVVREFEQSRFADAATLDANYLRRTDAEIFVSSPKKKMA